MKVEALLQAKIEEVQNELNPGQALDPATIAQIILDVLEFIRGCRNPDAAIDAILNNRLGARWAARLIAFRNGLGFSFGAALAKKASEAGEAAIRMVVAEASALPSPPTTPPANVGTWPKLLLLPLLLLMGSTLQAATWPGLETDTTSIEQQSIDQHATWPTAIVTPAPRVTPPTPQDILSGTKVDVPNYPDWSYSGDHGPESLRQHLLGSNHIDWLMEWIGVSSVAEFKRELNKLSHAELIEMHSLDHERQQGRLRSQDRASRRVPIAQEVASTTATTVQAASPKWVKKSVPAGLFGNRTKTVWMPAGGVSQSGYSSGCPGGYCPR